MRRSGKTTRLIDRCIQELFKNGVTYVYEGRGTVNATNMTNEAMYIFRKRMKSEHSEVKYDEKYTEVDGIKCYLIKLKSS